MSHDRLENGNIIALFPCVYYGLLASYSFFHIFALRDYEGKDGQWGSFKIELWIQCFATFMAFMSYYMGLCLVKTAVWRLSCQKLTLITTTSAFLSGVVLIVIEVIESYTWSAHIVLCLYLGGLLLIPALIGVSLVKTGQVCLARRQSIQQ